VVRRLHDVGLTPADVDLVTVGMGGNDAKFGDIVMSCVIPNIGRRLLRAYPNAPGEIEFVADKGLTCELLDRLAFKTDEAINQLAVKQRWAQQQLLAAFGRARIMQLNYPDVLPVKKGAPAKRTSPASSASCSTPTAPATPRPGRRRHHR
jgi:hypothetical protein